MNNLTRNEENGNDDGDDDFYNAMSSGEDLIAVIRGAIHIENQLIRIIEAAVVDKSAVDRMRPTYDDRVNLAIAFGLNPGFRPPLNALGTIRNNFAHKLNAALSDSDANKLYDSFDPRGKTIIQTVYQSMRKDGAKRPAKISALSPRDRFSLYVTALRGGIISASRRQAQPTN